MPPNTWSQIPTFVWVFVHENTIVISMRTNVKYDKDYNI